MIDAVQKIKEASFTGSDGLDYVETLVALDVLKKATFIPDNATNGDIIKALFPKIDDNFSNVIDLKLWWNAQYKTESEK